MGPPAEFWGLVRKSLPEEFWPLIEMIPEVFWNPMRPTMLADELERWAVQRKQHTIVYLLYSVRDGNIPKDRCSVLFDGCNITCSEADTPWEDQTTRSFGPDVSCQNCKRWLTPRRRTRRTLLHCLADRHPFDVIQIILNFVCESQYKNRKHRPVRVKNATDRSWIKVWM